MVYPPFITLIVCGFFKERLPEPVKVIALATAVAFVCGVLDGLHAAGLD
jgi:LIVCS family branched-chain amino acid:cation transporter